MSGIEIAGVIFGLISIYYTIKENIWCWPSGIINIGLFFALFYRSKLYADMGLQVVFFILSIYGWYEWLRGGEKKSELPISRISKRGWQIIIPLIIFGTAGLGYFLSSSTDASLPWWDSAATVLSLIAQYLLAEKKLENYLIWIVVDILSIGIYFVKELYLTGALFCVYLVFASIGYYTWRKRYRENKRVDTGEILSPS